MIATQSKIITSEAQIAPGVIVDSDVNASAAIQASKLQTLSVGANAGVIPSTGVADAHVSATAAIADTKLAQITTAGKVSGAALTSLASVPVGAGKLPAENVSSSWELLGSTTLSGTAASISVASFATRKFLRVYLHSAGFDSAENLAIEFNSDTGTNYNTKVMRSDGTSQAADTSAAAFFPSNTGSTSTTTRLLVMDIANTSASLVKIISGSEARGITDGSTFWGFWNNTAAQISTINVRPRNAGPVFAIGTTMHVYGSAT